MPDANSAHRRHRPEPLRAATRAEAADARRALRGWRTRKLGAVFLAMPVVVVAGVGIAIAAPHHHKASGPACSAAAPAHAQTTNTGANTGANAAAGAANGRSDGDVSGASEHMTTVHAGYQHSASASAAAGAASTSAAAGTTTSTSAAAGAASTSAAAGTSTTAGASSGAAAGTSSSAAAGTTSAAAGTTTSGAAATTTTSAAACMTSSAAAAPAATPNPNCTLIVPANPLTAKGLATPYQLVATDAAMGPCNEANGNQSAFVEAAIVTAGGKVSLYDPLVVDKGTQPAAATVPAQVPAGSTVGIWFGFNGTNLTLQSAAGANSLAQGNCVNGMNASIFGQFAYCNAPNFFGRANMAIANRTLRVPAAGRAKDGGACPTVRDFSVVDQDQSDNVVTHYLANANGQIAQNNPTSAKALGGNATDLANGSDNLLLTKFVDPALGCTPFTAPDQSSGGQASGSLPLDELSAAANQRAPIAVVPLNDPMTLDGNGNQDAAKTNLYRAGVDQPMIGRGGDNGSGATYCRNLYGNASGIARVFKDKALFSNAPSVDTGMATNLFTFLGMRANQSFMNLGCDKLLNMPDPIALTTDANGVVTAAVMVPLGQTPPTAAASAPAAGNGNGAGAASPTPSATKSHRPPRHVRW